MAFVVGMKKWTGWMLVCVLLFSLASSVALGEGVALQSSLQWKLEQSQFVDHAYYKYYAVLYDREKMPVGYFQVLYKWLGTVDPKYLSFVIEPESNRLADGRELMNGALGLRFSSEGGSLLIDLDNGQLPIGLRGRVVYASGLMPVPESGMPFANAQLFYVSKQLVGLSVVPAQVSIARGKNARVQVTARYSDQSRVDVTGRVVWRMSKSGIVAAQAGKLVALKTGACKLTGTFGGKTVQVSVVVR